MQNIIGIAKARERFSEIVNRAAFGRERFIVERRGKPLATLMGAEEYEELMTLLADKGVNDEIHGIPVRIHYDQGRYFVSDDIIDLYGVGNTIEEARADYWLAVQEAYEDLSAHESRLSPHLQEQLAYLRKIVDESAEQSSET
jgi:prevent-host-death family protein